MRALPRTGVAATTVAVTAAMVLLLWPTGGRDQPAVHGAASARPSVSPPTDPNTDYRNPGAVCLRFAAAVYRRDTAADPSAQTAYRRAMAYATGELATALAAQPDAIDTQWAQWQAHRVSTEPAVTAVVDADGQPADGVADAYRAARATVTPVGADRWRGPTEVHLVHCTLHRDGGGWRIAGYDLSDGSGTP
ncbi:MAG: hypothetical protein V7603_5074 [Micromonosporaceae bacterium]